MYARKTDKQKILHIWKSLTLFGTMFWTVSSMKKSIFHCGYILQ